MVQSSQDLFRSFQPTLTEQGLAKFGLTLQQVKPAQPLAALVHSYLQINAAVATCYPVIPDGSQVLYISAKGILIGGAQTKINELKLPAGEYFGIRFHAGALRHLFSLDLAEITDQQVPTDFFPCRDMAQLHEAIYQTDSFTLRAQLCQNWLLKHYKPLPSDAFTLALQRILQSSGGHSIADLAQQGQCSTRQLQRWFRQYTGLAPKAFSDIIRLQAACCQFYMADQTCRDLGYFDQSHLIHDFKKRLLLPPQSFFQRFMSDCYNPI